MLSTKEETGEGRPKSLPIVVISVLQVYALGLNVF
jgi:hypothetical protein